MKKLFIGLLALSSISAFASNICTIDCVETQEGSVFIEVAAAVSSFPSTSDQRAAYSRTCTISRPDQSIDFKNTIEGLEITAEVSQGQMSRSEQRYYEKHGRSKPSAKENRIDKQNKLIVKKLSKCIRDHIHN